MIQLEIFEILIDDSAFPFQIDELNLISQAKFQENFHPFVPSQSIFQKLSSYTVKLSEKAAVSDFNCNKTAGPVSATIKDGDNSLVVQFGIVSIFIFISDYLLSYSVQIVFSLMKFIRHSINLYIKYQVLIFHYELRRFFQNDKKTKYAAIDPDHWGVSSMTYNYMVKAADAKPRKL